MSIPDGLEALILPSLMALLRTEAPGISIRVQPLAVENLASALDDDEVDLAVVAVDLPLRNWHRRTEWLRCGFNCIYAPAHLQLPPSPTLADLAACDHVVSSYRGDATSTLDQLFAAHGLSRRVVASLASMASIMGTLRQSATAHHPTRSAAWSPAGHARAHQHPTVQQPTGRDQHWRGLAPSP